MSRLFNLIRNESMKLAKKRSSWVMMGVLIIGIVLVAILSKGTGTGQQIPWETQLKQQAGNYQQLLESDGISERERNYYEEELAIADYRLNADIPPLELNSFEQYLLDSKSVLAFVTLFTVIIGAGIVASEFTWGTIKMLMIRPVRRYKVLLSKYLTTLIAAVIFAGIAYVATVISGIFIFPSSEGAYLVVDNGEVVERSIWTASLFTYGLAFVNLLMMTTFAFMIGTVARSNALAIGLSIFLMFTGQQVVYLLSDYDWIKYYLFTHTDMTQYLQPRLIVEGLTVPFSVAVLAVYLVIFLAVSFFTFTKRDIAT
ncbi:ABC transporter permease [Thalassobacillus hwangdonensis]|uniref:ABC transporter permease n=1 Tax=Thalassobacillus hwangdonensis TaxID=546108 RepID=A0ABW3L6B2_9BACI